LDESSSSAEEWFSSGESAEDADFLEQEVANKRKKSTAKPAKDFPDREGQEINDDDEDEEEEEEDGVLNTLWTYDLAEMRVKKEFEFPDFVREINASVFFSDFTVEYVREHGLEEPLLFKDSVSALGMKMPSDGTLTAQCVLKAVGDCEVEVVGVMTQSSRRMMLRDFVRYYE
uniref:Coiled-coil domain-containing protein 81 n=1 Tax=Gongylonema pulchrum TaxID=637853 RepID=A0A183EKG5_9BILA